MTKESVDFVQWKMFWVHLVQYACNFNTQRDRSKSFSIGNNDVYSITGFISVDASLWGKLDRYESDSRLFKVIQ